MDQLKELNRILDDVMCECIHRPVTLYGNGRSGRFIKLYAKYYHNIDIAFYITDLRFPTTNNSYEAELFQREVFDYNYKNIKIFCLLLYGLLNPWMKRCMHSSAKEDMC